MRVGEIMSRITQRRAVEKNSGRWNQEGSGGKRIYHPAGKGVLEVLRWGKRHAKQCLRCCTNVIYRMDWKENETGGGKPARVMALNFWQDSDSSENPLRPTSSQPQKNLCTYKTVQIISQGDLQL